MSHVTCHVSRVTYHVSHVTCHISHDPFLSFWTMWWSLSMEGLLSTGPTPSSLLLTSTYLPNHFLVKLLPFLNIYSLITKINLQSNNMRLNIINTKTQKGNLNPIHIPNTCLRGDPDVIAALCRRRHSLGMSQNPCYFFPITNKKRKTCWILTEGTSVWKTKK